MPCLVRGCVPRARQGQALRAPKYCAPRAALRNSGISRVERRALARTPTVPVLFEGPEAVIGVLLAAAALLLDFGREVARLVGGGGPSVDVLERGLQEVDRSIGSLERVLDGSKRALAGAEAGLDAAIARAGCAEQALVGVGGMRGSLEGLLVQAEEASVELAKIEASLEEERERRLRGEEVQGEKEAERRLLDAAVAEREGDVERLRSLIEDVRGSGESALDVAKGREESLRGEIVARDNELEAMRMERELAATESRALEEKTAAMAEQVASAAEALELTRVQLEEAQKDLEERRSAKRQAEAERVAALNKGMQADKMRTVLGDTERELGELQAELRARDAMVNSMEAESDQLRSQLAARDAELHVLASRVESLAALDKRGGDADMSNMSLDQVNANLKAEQMALGAELTKAELASFALSEKDLDPLDRIGRELGAEKSLVQAGLRKAEAAVKIEEHLAQRREDAVADVLDSVAEGGSELTAVAKQAQAKSSEKETPPRRRRGRPSKTETKASDEPTPEKRKRGRPRKNAQSSE